MNKEIIIIAAISLNNIIGDEGCIPWRIPEEQQFFKRTTIGHPIIMGRKTYDSIKRPLPERRNIVISKKQGLCINGVEVTESLINAINLCQNDSKIFIIGGSSVYEQALSISTKAYITHVLDYFDGDSEFPKDFWKNFKFKKTILTRPYFSVAEYINKREV